MTDYRVQAAQIASRFFPVGTGKESAILRSQLVDAIASALAAAAPQWQPIETAPEATYILAFVPNYGINIVTGTKDPSFPRAAMTWFIWGDDDPCVPTMWTHIPALPPA